MAHDRDQPWWADAQDYRHRGTRRRPSVERADRRLGASSASRRIARDLDDRPDGSTSFDPVEDVTSAAAARRRRAAAARAAAQQRRARQRRPEAVEYQWIDDSPFSADRDDERDRLDRARERRSRARGADRGELVRSSAGARRPARRPASRRPARRRTAVARPDKLLLYAALLGLFLILAAATTSDAAVVHHAASLR